MNVYDFDNTIYDGESAFDLFVFYVKRHPKLLLLLPKLIVAFAKYKAGKVTVEQAMSKYAPLVEKYIPLAENLREDIVLFWDEHEKNIKPFYSKIRREDDLIITASPSFSMDEICRRLSIKNKICSEIDIETGKVERLCMHSAKVKAFFEEYPDAQIDCFYTDSLKNDRPLVDIAKQAYVVNGNKIKQIK